MNLDLLPLCWHCLRTFERPKRLRAFEPARLCPPCAWRRVREEVVLRPGVLN